MNKKFKRLSLLIGEENINKLSTKKVAIFGLGGVGGYVCEALVRSGIENFVLVDNDIVDITNFNRQIIATETTLGKKKTEVMKERMLAINPNAKIEVHDCFYLKETAGDFDFSKYDYVSDCVDTVSAKISLVEECDKYGTPIISAMGAGNKMDPTKLTVSDIFKTSVDPLCKVMRHELKKRNIKKLKVVYSTEIPIKNEEAVDLNSKKRSIPGSNAFVPSAMGLIIASEIIKDLIGA